MEIFSRYSIEITKLSCILVIYRRASSSIRKDSQRSLIPLPIANDGQRRRALKINQQLILYLRHASKCTNDYCIVTRHCDQMKELWYHLTKCDGTDCSHPYCRTANASIVHYCHCTNSQCSLCGPIRTVLRLNRCSSY